MSLWERLAGGIVPVGRKHEREVYVSDGAAYTVALVWLRRSLTIKYSTPTTPRDVRKARAADTARSREIARRGLAGEPLVKIGDHIPKWATAFLEQCSIVRDSEFTLWKRAVGDERYHRFEDDGTLDRSQEYDWIAWSAGEWGGGWSTNDGVLDYAPLTVLELIKHAAS